MKSAALKNILENSNSALTINHRFECVELLNQDQWTQTFLGRDSTNNAKVIIKITYKDKVASLSKKQWEEQARIFKYLNQDSETTPLTFGTEKNYSYSIRPYSEGKSVENILLKGPLSIPDSIALAESLMKSLSALHQENYIHGNLKPSNIIIQSNTNNIVLVDHGFVKRPLADTAIREQALNAIRYMSPEQAGLINATVDNRSDLYSAGVILYTCISGSCPIQGESINAILKEHLVNIPPALSQIPRSLDDLIHHLFNKDINDRYQTAEGVLEDVRTISQLLNKGEKNPVIAIGCMDVRSQLTEPAFIGRKKDFSNLDACLQKTRNGKGGLVLLEAESGGGKTRLLNEFSKRSSGCLVAWGQGLDQVAQRPFQVLVDISEGVKSFFKEHPERKKDFCSKLEDTTSSIVTLLPELKEIFPHSSEELGPENFGQIRSLEALTKFLDALGSQATPALLILDDCQWADEFTLKLLRGWQEKINHSPNKPCHALIIAAFRTDEVSPGHVLRDIIPMEHITLTPLEMTEAKELIGSMAGRVPDEAASTVFRLSSGSPFMTSAILRGLVESEILTHGKKSWEIDPLQRKSLQSSSHAAQFLMKRIELLPPGVLKLLTTGAILGKEFKTSLAAVLADQSKDQSTKFIAEAKARHMVWVSDQNEACTFVHDKLRESFLKRLPLPERMELHHAAAAHLEAYDRQRTYEIAFHFDAAGNSARALPFALASAERARHQHSLEISIQQYKIAARGVPENDPITQKRIYDGLGDVLLLKGEYEEAQKQFELALNLAQENSEKAQIMGKLGELAFKKGNVSEASRSAEEGLKLLGYYVPQSDLAYILLASWEIFIQLLHTLFPFLLGKKKITEKNKYKIHAIHLLSRLAYIYWFEKGKWPCTWAHLKEMNAAERFAPSPELAQAYSEHAPVMTMVPIFSRAIDYAQRSFAIRKQNSDLWGQGQSLHFHGVALYASSRFEEAIEKCRTASRLLEKTGDRWEVNTANWHIAYSLYRMGKLKEAIEMFRYVYQEGKRIGDHQATAISLSGWSKSSHGDVPRELIRTELALNTGDKHTAFELYQGKALVFIREENYTAAIEVLYKADAIVEESGFQSEYVAPIPCWLATALRLQSKKAKQSYGTQAWKQIVSELSSVTQKALRISYKYKNNLPHALRERAYLYAIKGKPQQALELLNRSEGLSTLQGAQYELAQTLLAKAELGKEYAWADWELSQTKAQDILKNIDVIDNSSYGPQVSTGKPVTISLIDRFDTLVAAGRTITTCFSSEDIYLASKKALSDLLRAEECLLIKWNEEENKLSSDPTTYKSIPNEEVILKSFSTGKTQILADNPSETHPQESDLNRTGSALCTPFFVRGKKAGCFYLIHKSIGALFGEEEVQVADFIAAITGVALENAENFSQLHRLNEDLKLRMQEQKKTEAELKHYATHLRRSNNDLEQFAYVASHDLKEPLRMVTSYVQLLAKEYQDKLGEEAKEYIQYAVEGTHRMYELIEALLAYSRVEHADETLVDLDFNQVAKDVLNNLQSSIEEAHAEISIDPLPTLRAGKIQMMRVFQNLIGNALKFHSDKPLKIKIWAEHDGEYWRFAVKDNGIGIDPKYSDRIFVIFQRLHHREKYPGTGIGLAICKKTVSQHGGQIWFESKEGEGSTFYFTLPMHVELKTTRILEGENE